MRIVFAMAVLLCIGYVSRAQIAIVNCDFNSGASYAGLTPLTAPNITCAVSSTQAFSTAAGNQTGMSTTAYCQGYAPNSAGNGLATTALNGAGPYNYIFQLGGANLSCYRSFKIYFDVFASATGPTSVGLQYSLDGVTYTVSATSFSAINTGAYSECNFDLSGITALDNQSSVYFKIVPTCGGCAAAGTFRIDNFQVQAVQNACFPSFTLGPNALSVYNSESGAGCDGNCDLSAFDLYYPTCTTGGAGGTCQAGGAAATEYPAWASLDIPAACSATITAEYGYPYSQTAAMCPDSRMDAGDVVGISIGTSTTTNDGTCSYNAALSGGTGSTGVVVAGCTGTTNTDQSVTLVVSGPTTATIWGNMNRSDEVIIYTAQVSTAACYTTVVTTVLPVEIISFVAYKNPDGNIQLKWATQTETNNDHFVVEFSFDARSFISYTKVKGAGNSYIKQEYSCVFSDVAAFDNKTIYFRLKQVDYNGNFKYSPVILTGSSWGTKNSSKDRVSAFYNSERDNIIIRFHLDYPQSASVFLYDMNGVKINEISQSCNEGDNEMRLDAPAQAGVYMLIYQAGEGVPLHKKVLIQK